MSFLRLSLLCILLSGCATTSANRRFELERSWVKSTLKDSQKGYNANPLSAPVLVDSVLLQGNSTDGLVAFNLSGRELWRLDIKDGVNSGIEVDKDTIYFSGSDGQAYAASLQTGSVKWSFPTRAEGLATPRYNDGVLFILSGNNVIYALDAATGRQKWVYDRAAAQSDLSIRGGTKPAFYKGSVFVGFTDGYLVALNANDGSVKWERLLNSNPKFKDVDSSPILVGHQVYVSSFDHALYSLNADDGQILWRFEDGGATPVTLVEDTLYVASSSGFMRALQRKTGQVIWEKKLPHGIGTQPAYHKGILVFAESSGQLQFWDAKTGQAVGHYDLGWGSLATPVISAATEHAFVVTNAANVHAIRMGWRTGPIKGWRKE